MSGAPSGIVTLLTDFGLDDPYVGIMKGAALSAARDITLIDVCHGVPAQNVELAARWLEQAFRWFPEGSVHLAVVDPGVGSERRALAARAGGHFFVAPDNGLLTFVAASEEALEARALAPATLGISLDSRTFHGRDLFAKVAARLAAGKLEFDALGAPVEVQRLDVQAPTDSAEGAKGRVVAVDHFGNLITDLPGPWLEGRAAWLGAHRARRVGTYAEAERGECVVLVGSYGLVEIAARDASAASLLAATAGSDVTLRREEPR